MRIVFDLDGVIALPPGNGEDYIEHSLPHRAIIEQMTDLHAAGHRIIIYTARRMRTHQGNVGAVIAECGARTMAWLQQHRVPFHELVFGKPYADLYVDDRAVGFSAERALAQLQQIGR